MPQWNTDKFPSTLPCRTSVQTRRGLGRDVCFEIVVANLQEGFDSFSLTVLCSCLQLMLVCCFRAEGHVSTGRRRIRSNNVEVGRGKTCHDDVA